MKTFADAAMYHKEPRWSNKPEDVFRQVGTPVLPSRPLIEYSLTTPGIHTLIIGIGQIDNDPMKCQLVQNYYACQIEPDGLTNAERENIELLAAGIKDGKTNYFQMEKVGLLPPRLLQKHQENGKNLLTWQTAYAGDHPIVKYEILADGQKVGEVAHKPQLYLKQPFSIEVPGNAKNILVAAVDTSGTRAEASLV
jgi:hypothetical protein